MCLIRIARATYRKREESKRHSAWCPSRTPAKTQVPNQALTLKFRFPSVYFLRVRPEDEVQWRSFNSYVGLFFFSLAAHRSCSSNNFIRAVVEGRREVEIRFLH